MKKIMPVAAALIAVALIAGFSLWIWNVEGRGEEDTSLALRESREAEALVAEALLPLVDRVEAMRAAMKVLPPGSPDYERNIEKLTNIQNLMASQMPELVVSTDSDGNATILPVDQARLLLEQIAEGGNNR